ncbi:hypothetical protein ACLKA7_004279 [Drosophila subpalustris]
MQSSCNSKRVNAVQNAGKTQITKVRAVKIVTSSVPRLQPPLRILRVAVRDACCCNIQEKEEWCKVKKSLISGLTAKGDIDPKNKQNTLHKVTTTNNFNWQLWNISNTEKRKCFKRQLEEEEEATCHDGRR